MHTIREFFQRWDIFSRFSAKGRGVFTSSRGYFREFKGQDIWPAKKEREDRGVASALVLKSSPFTSQKCPLIRRIALLFSRITVLFSRNALLFPGVALLFSKSVLLFPRSAFLFLKNASLFSRIVLEFSRIAFFLFPVRHLFFFSSWFNLLLVLLRATQREFSLLLLCFHLKLQLMMPSW